MVETAVAVAIANADRQIVPGSRDVLVGQVTIISICTQKKDANSKCKYQEL
jgi:hypothetical protein